MVKYQNPLSGEREREREREREIEKNIYIVVVNFVSIKGEHCSRNELVCETRSPRTILKGERRPSLDYNKWNFLTWLSRFQRKQKINYFSVL